MPEYINRPPRIQPELPSGEVEIPSPPQSQQQGVDTLIQVAIPLVTIFGYVLVAGQSGGRGGGAAGLLFVLPMAMSVLATTGLALWNFFRSRRIEKEQREAYLNRLITMRREMMQSHDRQRFHYIHNNPDMDTILAMVSGEEDESRLWERRTDDNDFGAVRLGMGTRPTTVVYKVGNVQDSGSPLLQDAMKLAEDSLMVHNIPITIPLRPRLGEDDELAKLVALGIKIPDVGRYAIGISGADRKHVSDFMRSLLVGYTAFHSPNDTRLYVIGSMDSKPYWEWARWLPHCNTSRNDFGRGDLLAFEPRKIRRSWDLLQNELQKRQLRSQDEDAGDVTLPFLVVVVDALSQAPDSPLHSLSTEAAIALLLTMGAPLGAAVIFLVPQRDQIPSECRAIIEMETADGRPTFRYAEIGLNSFRYDGMADQIEQEVADKNFARKLAPKLARATFGADVATSVNLLELFSILDEKNYDNPNQFPMLDWWRHSRVGDNAEWLRVPIGLMAGNKVRSLTYAADADGVHGLVAGTTGSGKSELLITLIVGLGMRYDPSVVNFVLADYKGGTAFDPMKPMPHAVDVVSSLQGLAGVRTFTATKAEMNRRSSILADTNTKHIVHYRQKNLHETREPFPFLFIIVDEFAEMVKEYPEFKGYLDSITRLGRALGVSLILATQRPAGVVTDQMRSNIKWRVCLRVETGEDSRELLKRSDASFLPNNIPGRGYLQVGNENIELIQVARAGAPYTGDQAEADPPVVWRNRGTSAVNPKDASAKSAAAEVPAISDLIIARMARIAAENDDVVPQRKPWPDPLPNRLTLEQERLPGDIKPNPNLPLNGAIIDWMEGEGGWRNPIDWQERAMRARIGLVDNPARALQTPLTIDFNRGHAAVFGASGWGKTVMMRTVITTLAATHSPSELHIYIVDFGGKGLDVVRDLPHVATYVVPSEDDRFTALLRRIQDELEQRKSKLSETRTDSIAQYNAAHPDKPIPAMLVVIDNFMEIKENYESVIPELTTYLRDGRSNAIHFIITAQQPNAIPNKMFNMITERMTFRLPDTSDYSGVVGRVQAQLPEVGGRGFIQVDGEPLEMQIALPVNLTTDDEVRGLDNTKKLGNLVKIMNDTWGDRPRPQSVDLVKALTLMDLFAYQDKIDYQSVLEFPITDWWAESRKAEKAHWPKAPLGLVTGNKVRGITFDQNIDGVHGMVAGTTGSGKSELLLTLVAGVAMRYDPSVCNFILADYKGGAAFEPLKGLPHAVDIVTSLQGMAGVRTFTAMKAEMNRRSALLAETNCNQIVQYRTRNLHEKHKPFPFLFIIVDEFAEMVKENPEFKGNLDSITRLGRALGVFLILATQRPAGVVTDQMRSNIKWRICLRVETGPDSRELLKRDDAAYLPNTVPGRGYIQVGNDNIELMQTARAGGPYSGALPDYLEDKFNDTPALTTVLTLMMEQMAHNTPGVQILKKPYPDPLPRDLNMIQKRLSGDMEDNPLLPLSPAIKSWLEGNGDWPGIDWQRQSMRANIGLIDDPAHAQQLPLTINFNKGHVALFGASGWGKTIFCRTLVTALAATHSPKELHVYMMDFGGKGLDVLLDLPHVACSVLPGEDDRVAALLRRLSDEMESRKTLLSQARSDNLAIFNAQFPDRAQPNILVIIDNFAEFRENYEALIPDLQSIVRDGRANGIHFVLTSQQTGAIPSKLYNMLSERMTFRMTDTQEYGNVVGRNMPNLPEIPGRGFIVVENEPLEMQVAIPVVVTKEDIEEGLDATKKLGKLLTIMRDKWGERPRPQSVDLVRQLSLMELFEFMDKREYKSVLDFPILDWWAESRKPEKAEWLRAPVGLVTGNKVRALIFDQQIDGVHGMVAGTTGSGKSELLLTVVAGLAMRYDPSVVNFILADYKGGSAFDPFKGLPHAVDIVTNLQGLAGARTFTAMKAEMNRRSALLAKTQTKHVVDYRKRNLHERNEPFPFLFVVVDEFAEMVKENPEFKGNLDSITRLGRALGVCLILATQRPAGVVTDQMRSNIKWRICLRVETADDSKELLKRADAAFLPNTVPGRAFLQVGNDNLELMQVARAGGPYYGTLPEFMAGARDEADEADELFLSNILTAMMAEFQRQQPDLIKPQVKPYPDPLPERVTLDQTSLPGDRKQNPLLPLSPAIGEWNTGKGKWKGINWMDGALEVNIGLVDNPIEAAQLPLEIDLKKGHVVAFGLSGMGKTIFLRTLVMALAATHSPAELNVFCLDLGGKGLNVLNDLPHVSAPTINAGEDERIQRLLRRAQTEIDQRKDILSKARADNFLAYNAANPKQVMPAILIIMDNFSEFRENYEYLFPDLTAILREGRANGVFVVVTGDLPQAMPNKMFSLFTERIALKLSETADYMGVVGRVPGLPQEPGRGFISHGKASLEAHVAMPVSLSEDEVKNEGLDDTKKLVKLIEVMAKAWRGPRPGSIDVLHTNIPLRNIMPNRPRSSNIEAVLGIDDTNLDLALFDLQAKGPHFVIIGPPLSGKTTTLRTWVLSLTSLYTPHQVKLVLVDFRRKFFRYGNKANKHSLADLPHVVATVSDPEEMEEVVLNLRAEFEAPEEMRAKYPPAEIYFIADNYDDFGSALGRSNAIRDLADIANKYGPEGFHAVLVGSTGVMRGQDDFLRRSLESRFGLGLDTGESANNMGGRLRSSTAEFPAGRGYIVRSGRTTLMQVATPQDENAASMEESLDKWVGQIAGKYQGQKARWLVDLEPSLKEMLEKAAEKPKGPSKAASNGQGDAVMTHVDQAELAAAQEAAQAASADAEKRMEELEKAVMAMAAETVKPQAVAVTITREELERRKAEANALKAKQAAEAAAAGQKTPNGSN